MFSALPSVSVKYEHIAISESINSKKGQSMACKGLLLCPRYLRVWTDMPVLPTDIAPVIPLGWLALSPELRPAAVPGT